MNTALFIGRFQPFHSGHASVVQHLATLGYDRVIIGIGSTQYNRQSENPLTLAERITCIVATLNQTENIPSYSIVLIPDIHDDKRWVAHVDSIVSQETSQYTATYTGNALVASLFEQAGKPVQAVTKSIAIDGTTLRQMISQHDGTWQSYINPSIRELVRTAVLQRN